jgi:hypothetical protein
MRLRHPPPQGAVPVNPYDTAETLVRVDVRPASRTEKVLRPSCELGGSERQLIWRGGRFWAVAAPAGEASRADLGRLDWFSVLACQMPVSSGVIAWEIKTLCYHGSLADRLNPNLKDFLEGRIP